MHKKRCGKFTGDKIVIYSGGEISQNLFEAGKKKTPPMNIYIDNDLKLKSQ